MIIIIAALMLCINIYAQFEPNPELVWKTIETRHFYVHYHTGSERTARLTAKIAEEIYGPITSLYDYRPSDKTSWIINDESDISGGATDYYGNRIEISAVSLDYDLRGTHNWLRNVITHEFVHIIQLGASMKFSRKIPSLYFQFLNYEDERRPDVLYGYPNTIISYPFSGTVVPAWFAEGTAQYQRQQMGYDYWDSHRDMILRMRALDNKLLSWEEMGQFASVTSYSAESIYNSGFALVMYISDKYGEDKIKEIASYLSDPLRLNSEDAFSKSIGISGRELYNEWKKFITEDYRQRTELVSKFKIEGEPFADVGFANYYPKFSPDGEKVSYLSNKTYDYGSTSLFLRSINKKDDILIQGGVSGNYSWHPDGKKIIFSKRSRPNVHGAAIFDLYEYEIKSENLKRLTVNLRAHSPSYSRDGQRVCFVINKDGTQNLYIAPSGKKLTVKDIEKVTNYSNGEQIYSAGWSPDGNYIIYDYSKEDLRSIKMIDLRDGKITEILGEKQVDYRNPGFSNDGKHIIFASDKTGIYNIYRLSLDENESAAEPEQLTNVTGGAFMPDVDSKGNLVYSSWQSDGYKIYLLKQYKSVSEEINSYNAVYIKPERLIRKYHEESFSKSVADDFNWHYLREFNDDSIPEFKSTSYNNVATPLFIIPVLRFDNYHKSGKFADIIKPGVYFYSQDVLGRMGIFGGASLNRKLERDIFLQFDYNNGVPFAKDFFLKKLGFAPHFNIAGYNVTRKTNADLLAGLDTINVDVTYDLLQFDFNMAFNILNSAHRINAGFTYSYYTSKVGTFIIPAINRQVPSFSTNYFQGRDLSLTYTYRLFTPGRNDDINPIGRYFRLRYDYEINDLNPSLVVDDQGNVTEQFEKAKFHRVEADLLQGWGLFNNSHSLSIRLRGGSILGPAQDNFFDFYASGFPNMKGYPFYAIGGNRFVTANITYRFPLLRDIRMKLFQFYFDKLYFSVYGDIGNAWNGKAVKLKDFKKDIGFELRLLTYSYYAYPTAFAFNAAYGLDRFSRIFPSTTGEEKLVTYGKEWRYYFTVLFGFDFLVDNIRRIGF